MNVRTANKIVSDQWESQEKQDYTKNQSPIGRTDTGCESGIAAVLEGRNMTKKDAQSPVNYQSVPHDKDAP